MATKKFLNSPYERKEYSDILRPVYFRKANVQTLIDIFGAFDLRITHWYLSVGEALDVIADDFRLTLNV
jgi:hypothetical protein